MRLFTGKRIGQTGGEFAAALSFSLFLHLIAFLAALFVSWHFSARIRVPTIYSVKLVDIPADVPLTASSGPASAPAARAAEPKAKPAAAKARQPQVRSVPKAEPVPKAAMPELGAEKKKPQRAVEAPAPAAPSAPAAPAGGTPGKKQEAVAVSVSSGGEAFPFPPYVAIVRDKVERNWNPPPGVKGLKARVTFRVQRSGMVGDVKLDGHTGNFYFDQAAMRAILASSPFPPLPEGFFRDYEVFSVDLMERQ